MNPIEALYHKSQQALQAAQLLFNEKFYLFAVGRAYYATFYMAEAILLTQDLSFSKHSGVIGNFNKIFIYQNAVFEPEMGKILSEGFDMRNVGDYDSYVEIEAYQAIELLAKATLFCQKITEYLQIHHFL